MADRYDQENQVTFLQESPASGRKGMFVAVDLREADADRQELLTVYASDTSLWLYFEGELPRGLNIEYFEVDPTMSRIVGLA